MSIQIVNGFTGPVVVTSAGRSYTLPSGFNGSLTLEGVCTVAGGGQTFQIPTYEYGDNHPSSIQLVNATGHPSAFYSDLNGTAWPSGTALYGTPVYFSGGSVASQGMQVGAIPNGSANVVLTVSESPPGTFVTSYLGTTYHDAISTNSVTTNTANTALGNFTASAGVRSVEIHAAGLNVTDFEAEATAVAAGFMLAATIAAFRYVMRLARAVTSQGGDF